MNIAFADRLVQLRRAHGFSQEELAHRLGLSRQAISKWERAEASPDTDNLIALARLYGITLDELVDTEREVPPVEAEEEPDEEPAEEPDGDKVSINWRGIHVQEKNGDEVEVDWRGVRVIEKNGDKVQVNWEDGIHLRDANGEKVHISPDGASHHIWAPKRRLWEELPVPILSIITFLLLGFLGGWWHPGWVVFFAIPLYPTLTKAISRRDPRLFAWPVFTVPVYILLGHFGGWWHPGWVIFLTIPLYYWVASFVKKT